MRALIISLVVLVISIGFISLYQEVRQLQLKNKKIESEKAFEIKKAIFLERQKAVDSMLIVVDNMEPSIIYKERIKIKYEKISDSTTSLPATEQFEYVARELERLYGN